MAPRPRAPYRDYLALTRGEVLLTRLRRHVLVLLVAVAMGFMVLSANSIVQGRLLQGLASGLFNVLLLVNASAFFRGRQPPVPLPVIMGMALAGMALAAWNLGIDGLLWAYPAILLFHFLAPARLANAFNLAVVAVAVPIAWMQLGGALALRMGAGLGLTILFTNLFSIIAEQQQRKEAAQARQLEQQNARLLEAIRMREEVERIARHDLRTPLNSIASVPRLLREERPPTAREDELLTMVERSAHRVLAMVNLSLDLYRMEEGSYQLRAQPLDLAAVARSVARDLQEHAATKQVAVRVEAGSAPVLACGEELLTYTLLANLAKNALEAAPDHSAVRIAVRDADDGGAPWVQASIHNQGAVPATIRDSFFEKYATYGKAGGMGLGAYSARLMARMQRGTLDMASSETDGTTLTLRLPRADEAQRVQHFTAAGSPHAPPSPDGAAALPALTVLLVDDDPYNLLVLRGMLPSPPLRVLTAINGRAALDAVREHQPQVILMDLEMPVMGGYAATEQIRALQAGSGQRSTVIAFSAHDDEATRAECLRAGFDSYLPKPASRPELMRLLADAGARHAVPGAPDEAAAAEPEMLQVVQDFLASRRTLVAQLRAALEAGARDEARRLAHKLAGGLAMYGLDAASDAARAIERTAATEALPGLQSQACALGAVVDGLRVEEVLAGLPR